MRSLGIEVMGIENKEGDDGGSDRGMGKVKNGSEENKVMRW